MGQWLDSITGWLTLNPEWLAVAVFIVACVECLAIAGLIVPGTVLLFAIAALAGSGALSLSETLLVGFLGGATRGRGFLLPGSTFPSEHPAPARPSPSPRMDERR